MVGIHRSAWWCRGSAAAFGIVLLLVGVGCRQTDGDMPVPDSEQVNKVEDIGRDLQNIANGDQAAPMDLIGDLKALGGTEPPDDEVRALTAALSTALAGRALPDAQAQGLAAELFVASTGRRLSRRQITRIDARLREILTGLGVPDAAVEGVATSATALATAITENRPRWYQLF